MNARAAAIPLGDNRYASVPQAGSIYSCQTAFPSSGQGASVAGPWINTAAGTWNKNAKVAVAGSVAWPGAQVGAQVGA